MSIESVIKSVLSANSTVASLCGTRIYPVGAKLDPPLAYLTYAIDEAEAITGIFGTAALKRYSVLVQFWTKTKANGVSLSDAVFAALSDYRSGATQRIKFTSRTDVDEDGGRYEASHLYDAWHSG